MKQETLEEALKSYVLTMSLDQSVYIDFLQCAELGAKWQQERMYSEEEIKFQANKLLNDVFKYKMSTNVIGGIVNDWFEQFKKK